MDRAWAAALLGDTVKTGYPQSSEDTLRQELKPVLAIIGANNSCYFVSSLTIFSVCLKASAAETRT